MKVLVVDDEKAIVKGIAFSIQNDGNEVDCAYDGEEALDMIKKGDYDIVLLDVMLPKMDGFEVCRQVREFSKVPIIMLTAKNDDMDKIAGLTNGADDYVAIPFSVAELIARISALLRWSEYLPPDGESLTFGQLVIDVDGRGASVNGKAIKLTSKEYELLRTLAEHQNTALDRRYLMKQIWGYTYTGVGKSRTLDVHIRHLREKLGAYGECIQTVYMIGYKFVDPDSLLQKCLND